MSYTSEELKEIAENIEAFRVESRRDNATSCARDEQLFRIVKDLYKKSHGIYTKEAEEEYLLQESGGF